MELTPFWHSCLFVITHKSPGHKLLLVCHAVLDISSLVVAATITGTHFAFRFSVAAPRVWNSLSEELRADYDSLCTFKNNLKTFLYRRDIT